MRISLLKGLKSSRAVGRAAAVEAGSVQRRQNQAHDRGVVFDNQNAVLAGIAACDKNWNSGTGYYTNRRGERWGWGTTGVAMFNTIVTPNSKDHPWSSCRWNCNGCGADASHIANATSNHPGGVNVVMADGHVQFIKDSVAMRIWWSLGTRAGGEVLSADAY